MKELILSIDIGGTEIKYALVDEDLNISDAGKRDTEAHKGGEHIISSLKKIYDEFKHLYLIGLAISSSGQVNSSEGKIHYAISSFSNYTGTEIKKIMEEYTHKTVTVINDVNAMALAEYKHGNYTKEDVILFITLGTGIGGSIIYKGALMEGFNGVAGEVGHMSVKRDGKPCSCGKKGCWELYASTSALVQQFNKVCSTLELNGIDFFSFVERKEDFALHLLSKWADEIAFGLSSLVHTVNPNYIIIGGGVSSQKEMLTDPINQHLKKYCMKSFYDVVTLETAKLENHAGLMGATIFFLENLKNELIIN